MFFNKKKKFNLTVYEAPKKKNKGIDPTTKIHIDITIQNAKRSIDLLKDCTSITQFSSRYEYAKQDVLKMVDLQKEYPSVFKEISPLDIYMALERDRFELECTVVDKVVSQIERKLLKYTTEKGKQNNFNKEFDIFRYDSEVALPQTFDYFVEQMNTKFPQYMIGRN